MLLDVAQEESANPGIYEDSQKIYYVEVLTKGHYGLRFVDGPSALVKQLHPDRYVVDCDESEGEDASYGEQTAVEPEGEEAEDVLAESPLVLGLVHLPYALPD